MAETTLPLLAFGVGDIGYLRYRAVGGVLEAVMVRQVRYDVQAGYTFGTFYDQHHARYNDDELVTREEAVALAVAHFQTVILKSERWIARLLA